ncbi:hypothetical protein MGSAQ_000994, partial [marine sediment metagenome]
AEEASAEATQAANTSESTAEKAQ